MQIRAPLPLTVCSWLADTVACVDHAHFDHAHRHRPAGQPVSITGQPPTPATDNLVSPTLVVLIIVYGCASAATQVRFYKVIVRVTDINDNSPIFHEDWIVLNISESMQPGTRFSLPVADDSDSQEYAVVEYRLQPREMQRIFTLDVVTEADFSQQVCLRVTYLRSSVIYLFVPASAGVKAGMLSLIHI